MATQSVADRHQPNFPRTNILSLVFLMLGAPHIYGFLNRPKAETRFPSVARYAMMALVAGAIASLVELSAL
ncbi:MAG: hypothetical protein O2890_10250 [Cyanobacteria bacterium]|nr:hypothetical protein [Cyanobacteriota bacterium]MDA0866781.1 hypothetical protein [Cyanobacteriota bacterium]